MLKKYSFSSVSYDPSEIILICWFLNISYQFWKKKLLLLSLFINLMHPGWIKILKMSLKKKKKIR